MRQYLVRGSNISRFARGDIGAVLLGTRDRRTYGAAGEAAGENAMQDTIRRTFCAALLLAFAALGPIACSSEPEDTAPAEAGVEPAATDPDAPEGISVSGGRMTLPAVAGNPGAVYFTVSNTGDTDLAIRSVSVVGAEMAMLHQTRTASGRAGMEGVDEVPVQAGEEVAFAPGGLHVMAMNLDDGLQQGGETEVTLTFANGDKVSFPAEIVGPGAADSGP